jgi:hypothetical protein
MRILIVDQCSSAKRGKGRYEPLDTETVDRTSRTDLIERDGTPSYRASDLYEGRQQQRISEAKEMLEEAGDDVDRIFISAGFGVVSETDELPLYDVTFANMTAAEIDERAEQLGIHEDLYDRIVGSEFDIIFFALGSDYYRSARLNELIPDVSDGTRVVFFNREELEEEYDNGLSLSARTTQAKKYGTIVIALKGEYLRNFASHRKAGKIPRDVTDIEKYCSENATSQPGLDDYSS